MADKKQGPPQIDYANLTTHQVIFHLFLSQPTVDYLRLLACANKKYWRGWLWEYRN